VGARIVSECYSDLVLRIPWYVAWPLLIAVGALALHFVAVRSVYFPVRHPEGFWSLQAPLGTTDVWLDSTGHVRIHGWFVAGPGSRRTTLFLHGNAGNITHRGRRFREITAAGSSVRMIDYRGYGKSTGRPSEDGLYADAEAAYEHLLKTSRPQEIIVHGESLGTASLEK
jgi:predicted alpha/beta-fold hydrolase